MDGVVGGKFGKKSDTGWQISPADFELHVRGWEECLLGHKGGLKQWLEIYEIRIMPRWTVDDIWRGALLERKDELEMDGEMHSNIKY